MIGRWLLRMMRNAEKEVYGPSVPDRPNHLSNALYNGQPVVSVFRISNGFVLCHSDYSSHHNTPVYCKEVSEIGDQIITLQARVAMGISPDVTIGASSALSGGMVKVAQQLQYPRS